MRSLYIIFTIAVAASGAALPGYPLNDLAVKARHRHFTKEAAVGSPADGKLLGTPNDASKVSTGHVCVKKGDKFWCDDGGGIGPVPRPPTPHHAPNEGQAFSVGVEEEVERPRSKPPQLHCFCLIQGPNGTTTPCGC